MDFIFNELSFGDLCPDAHSGKLRMQNLLQVCKEGRTKGMSRLAIRYDFYQQSLLDGYTVTQWLNDQSVSPILKNLFQSIVRHPYIEEADNLVQDRFISSYTYLNDDHTTQVEGLAVAYLYNTISISFSSAEKWDTHEVTLKFSEANFDDQIVKAKHASNVPHIELHKIWITSRIGVQLVVTERQFDQKKIALRDDHGKDLLLAFSRKLVRSQFVIEIVNSLPFNPHETDFIRRCHEDGKIEMVLTRSDQGFGVVIQTTGRTLQETEEIGKILDDEYQSQY